VYQIYTIIKNLGLVERPERCKPSSPGINKNAQAWRILLFFFRCDTFTPLLSLRREYPGAVHHHLELNYAMGSMLVAVHGNIK
jgi:hypothetical protein